MPERPGIQDLCERIAVYEQRLFNPTEQDLENKRILGVETYYYSGNRVFRVDLFLRMQLGQLYYCLGVIARTLHPMRS